MRVIIGFLVQGRVRIKIRVRVTVRVGVMFKVSIYHRSNRRRSNCRTFSDQLSNLRMQLVNILILEKLF